MKSSLYRLFAPTAALALLIAACSGPKSDVMPAAPTLRLDGVNVVDTRDGKVAENVSILMRGGKIVAVGPKNEMLGDNVKIIDATGQYVVPGFNDMHTHTLTSDDRDQEYGMMLANGITGFRQMDGTPELLQLRQSKSLGLSQNTPALLALSGDLLTPFNARGPSQVTNEVAAQKAQGADFIKMGVASPSVFYAALKESKRLGIPMVGHLQTGVDPDHASRQGFRSIEHLGPGDPVWIACSRDTDKLWAEVKGLPPLDLPPQIPGLKFLFSGKLERLLVNPAVQAKPKDAARLGRALDSFDPARCQKLAKAFSANDTWVVPTLMRLKTQELMDDPTFAANPNIALLNPDRVAEWRSVTDDFKKLPKARRAMYRRQYALNLKLVKLFDDADVPMMTGTDNGGWEIPGFVLHEEFDELARAGVPPLRILQMTTLLPARFLRRDNQMGRVAAGMNADLVLLEGNPIQDASYLHRISAVVRAGHFHSSRDLNRRIAAKP